MKTPDSRSPARNAAADKNLEPAEPAVRTPQTMSDSYRLAYADRDFLLRDELRPVRLQLELLKPELLLAEANVVSTIVVFGSARIPDPDTARRNHEAAAAAAELAPGDALAVHTEKHAAHMLGLSAYYDEARRFAELVSLANQTEAQHHHVIVTGGGPGIMEAANRGADEAGAISIGMNIVLPREQHPNAYITPEFCFQFHYFALRKMHFLLRARALVIFPGGFGTLDELFETLTLIQTGKIAPMPVILFGREYWDSIVDFERMAEHGVISPADLDILSFVETAEDAWRVISEFDAQD